MPEISNVENASTLIFDLDGTISNPSLGIYRSINYALTVHGYAAVSEAQVASEIGPPLDEAFKKFVPEAEQVEIENLIVTYRERYAEVGYSENSVYQGVSEALQALSSRGVCLGVCTSKRQDFAIKILSMFGLLDHFSFVNGGDVGIKKKDQLAGLLRSGQIDVAAVMIGDREIDITSAKLNGLRSVGVLWGFGDLNELLAAGANVVLSHTSELERLGI
jgi:phosphoglycolate phosphatase